MADFKLLNYAGSAGEPRPGILIGDDQVLDVQEAADGAAWAASTLSIVDSWDTACPALHKLADQGGETRALADVRLASVQLGFKGAFSGVALL